MAKMMVNGQSVDALSGATVEVRNPATGEVVDRVPKADAEDTRVAIDAAVEAFKTWSKLPVVERSEIIRRATEHTRSKLGEVIRALTAEQGKPLREAKIEATRFCENMEYYADLVKTGALAGKYVPLPKQKAQGLVVRKPIGVVGAIIPWNFPLTLMSNKIAPALAIGNTAVVKPASSTPLSTLKLAELLTEGGLPAGVLNIVTGPGGVVGGELIRNPKVRKIGFTGETETGKQIMADAAQDLKRVTLELGGSDAAIVMDDADVDLAARSVAIGRYFNAGQACLAIKRVFVHEAVYDEFVQKVAERAKKLQLGPGTDQGTQMGPLHNEGGVKDMEAFVQDAVQRGGKVLVGGKRPEGEPFNKGSYYQPTVLVDVPDEARVWREEVFGPVLPIGKVSSLDEAIEKANSSEFGLGSSIFTRDQQKALRAIDELEAGYTWVNAVQIVMDELPFGGVKHSGYGKEHGTEVLDFYTETKSVVMA